jgi:hypothetical protein
MPLLQSHLEIYASMELTQMEEVHAQIVMKIFQTDLNVKMVLQMVLVVLLIQTLSLQEDFVIAPTKERKMM